MLFCFVIVFLVLGVSGKGINPQALICLPVVMLVEYILALGFAMIVSAFTVYFRDLEHIMGVILQAWIYLTPIMYSIDIIPDNILPVFKINPMTSVIEAYHTILYFKEVPQISTLAEAFVIGIISLITGGIIFSRLQKGFVEEL